MDTSPMPSVFGNTGAPKEIHQVPPVSRHRIMSGGSAGRASADAAAAQAASAEIESISGVVAELQARLEEAQKQLGSVSAVRTTELEIGRLFVEAQRFSQASLAHLEQQIQEILAEAEKKAMAILREATEEAHEIRRQAQGSAYIPANTALKVQAAITGFSSINNELIKELRTLNSMLSASVERKTDAPDSLDGPLGTT